MAMHEIVYVSLATQEMSQDGLAELLDKARSHNASRGITGLLLYHRREFLQLIEGERSEVEALFESICRDTRHQQIHTLWEGPVQEPGFPGWSMGFVATDEPKLRDTPGYRSLQDIALHELPKGSAGKTILQHMRDEIQGKA
jgi:hypothetical protein